MRTLVVSDFHLGTRLRHDVLALGEPLECLLAAVEDVDRLVLLGDVVELMEGRAAHAMAVAEPVLRAIGRQLGPRRSVIIVPGNHDFALVAPWVRATGASLGLDAVVPAAATEVLAELASWLAPAQVSVRYPGVWLSDRVWATHGHYLDRHLLPESSVGIARGLLGRAPRDAARPADYEAVRVAASMPKPPALLLPPRMAPLTASVLGLQVRRAALPALARVVHRLGVDAEYVVFGHVHRLGPLPVEDASSWTGPGGRPRIVNSGSWVYEPRLVHRATAPHPYWPGGAVRLNGDGTPEPVCLLDGLAADRLR